MKIIGLTFLLAFFSVTLCSAQFGLSPVLAVQKQATLKRATARVFVIPSAGLRTGRNIMTIGPVVRLAQLDDVQPNKLMLTGVQATYNHIFTRKEDKKLQFYGEINSKYQVIEEEWQSNYWNQVKKNYVDYETESKETIWETSLGAGVAWSFNRNVSLSGSLGSGFYFSGLEYDDVDEMPDLFNATDYRGYRYRGFFCSFQLGIIFTFPDLHF